MNLADTSNSTGTIETRTVAALLCHDHVPMALDCLESLLRLCATPLGLRIHDDGSLTAQDKTRLLRLLPGSSVVERDEADARISQEFSRHPNILRWRRKLPLILKAVDAVVYCREPVYAYVDSDVLFLRRFESPFRLTRQGPQAIFIQDREHSYALRSWQKAMSPRVRLPARINTGFMVIAKDWIDFDLLEWFLGRHNQTAIPSMMEQTFLAMIGARAGCHVFDPAQVRVMRAGEPIDDLVAGHFTARTRHLLPDFVLRTNAIERKESPVTLKTIEPGACTAWDLFGYEARRALGRIVPARPVRAS